MAGGPEGGGSRRLEARSDPEDPPLEGAHVLRGGRGRQGIPEVDPDLRHPVQGDPARGGLRTFPDGLEDLVPVHDRVAVDDADPLPGAVPGEEPQGDPLAGPLERRDEGQARGEEPRDRGGQGTAAAVEVVRVAEAAVLRELPLAIQEVHELALEVAALHEDRVGPELRDRLRSDPRVGEGPDALAGETARLVAVRSDEGRAGEESMDEGGDEVPALQGGSDGRDHDRIDDKGELGPCEFVRDGPDDVPGVQHPCLRSADVEVPEDRAELGPDLRGRDREDRVHGAGVLRRNRGDDGGAVDADGGETLQVRLDPGASAGVAPRNREGRPHPSPQSGGPLKDSARGERLCVPPSSPLLHAGPQRTRQVRPVRDVEETAPRLPARLHEVPRGERPDGPGPRDPRGADRGEPARPAGEPEAGGVQPGGHNADDLSDLPELRILRVQQDEADGGRSGRRVLESNPPEVPVEAHRGVGQARRVPGQEVTRMAGLPPSPTTSPRSVDPGTRDMESLRLGAWPGLLGLTALGTFPAYRALIRVASGSGNFGVYVGSLAGGHVVAVVFATIGITVAVAAGRRHSRSGEPAGWGLPAVGTLFAFVAPEIVVFGLGLASRGEEWTLFV